MKILKKVFNKEDVEISKDALKIFQVNDNNEFISLDIYHAYWWDGKVNFGDLIGPWIISLISGKQVVNSKYLNVNHTTFTVGSIIDHVHLFPNQRISIWGSGLMRPLDSAKKIKKMHYSNIDNVLALRGALTKRELLKAKSINVALPLGDPALILPKLFLPSTYNKSYEICIVPHFDHINLFTNFKEIFKVIDVMQFPQNVVTEISNSNVCISTSLHGIIVAQAYGVPWVLLRIEDNPLLGDMFKFNDFFSTLEAEDIVIESILSANLINLDFNKIASRAYLPRIKVNLNDLISSFTML